MHILLYFSFLIPQFLFAEETKLLFDQEIKAPFLATNVVLLVEKNVGEIVRFKGKSIRLSALPNSQGLYSSVLGALANGRDLGYDHDAMYNFAFEISNGKGKFWISPVMRMPGKDLLVKSMLEEEINLLEFKVEEARRTFREQLDYCSSKLEQIVDPSKREKIASQIKAIALDSRDDSIEYFLQLLESAIEESLKDEFRGIWHEMLNYHEKMLIKNASVANADEREREMLLLEKHKDLINRTSGISISDLKARLAELKAEERNLASNN